MVPEIIICVVMSLLSIIGLCSIIRGLSRLLLCGNNKNGLCNVIMLYGENADIMLKSSIEQISCERAYSVYDGESTNKIVALNCGIDRSVYSACEKICNDVQIDLIEKNMFVNWLDRLLLTNKENNNYE